MSYSRRRFIASLGMAAAAVPFLPYLSSAHGLGQQTVPGLKIGYSAITWGGNDIQAIKDIASLGYQGVQLRSNVVKDYKAKPEELRKLLKQYKLALPMFSSGNANINTGDDEAVIQMHVEHAKFVKALGGRHIQLTNSSRPSSGAPTKADLEAYGRLINEIGKRSLAMGVQAVYHNHMHQLGETPEEVDIILQNCDEKNIRLLLDIAHYHQGGGDPAKAIRQYKKRLSALHLKDVRPLPEKGESAYIFVELGQGKVNLPAVFEALQEINFKGWGIVELDAVPDKQKTPIECARISHAYLNSLGIKI